MFRWRFWLSCDPKKLYKKCVPANAQTWRALRAWTTPKAFGTQCGAMAFEGLVS